MVQTFMILEASTESKRRLAIYNNNDFDFLGGIRQSVFEYFVSFDQIDRP